MSAVIRISYGELVDKITILEIKRQRLSDASSLGNVVRELEMLDAIWAPFEKEHPDSIAIRGELRDVNLKLWDIEDAIRRKEASRDFGDEFVELARAVYKNNDQRARLKRQINELLGSEIVEEKQYAAY